MTLGTTGITTTRLGLGMAWWPRQVSFDSVIEVLEAAFDAGIRHIDLAPLYGSEEIIGHALSAMGRPDDLVIVTKACAYWDFDLDIEYYAYSRDAVRRSVERSLKRIGVDRIDIVHVHDTRAIDLPWVFDDRGALATLEELKREGVIVSIGMATKDLDCLMVAVRSGRFDVIQTFHTNTLLNRTAHDALYPAARERGVAVLDSAPFAGYILGTGAIEGATYNYFPAGEDVVAAVRRVEAVCRGKGVTLQEAALAFPLRHPDVRTLTVSTKRPKRISEWTRALECPLTDADFAEIIEAAGPSVPLAGSLLQERLRPEG